MSRYYFHFKNGQITLDDHGTEIADQDALRKEAVRASREVLLATEGSEELWAGESARLWVTEGPNATGKTVLTIEIQGRE